MYMNFPQSMFHPLLGLILVSVLCSTVQVAAADSMPQRKYFAIHGPRIQRHCAWYRGQNGQCDFRICIAAETLKRYPWADKPVAIEVVRGPRDGVRPKTF